MINITFPDKSVRKFDSSITGHDLAKSISNSLAKNAICIEIDGELKDLSYLIEMMQFVKFLLKMINIPSIHYDIQQHMSWHKLS